MKNELTKEQLMAKLDLSKEKVIEISEQKGLNKNQKSQVVLCLDFSGSMDMLYRNNSVQKILERILPIAMAWDDNQECEVYIFSDNCEKIQASATTGNIIDFIDKYVYGKFRMGGTNYAPPIKQIINDFKPKKSLSSFFGFGKKDTTNLPTYVVFITDGENYDKRDTSLALIEASQYPIFFQFVGIGNSSFSYLESLDTMSGRIVDNANFFSINDFNSVTENVIYNRLLNEYPSYIKEIQKLGYI